MDLYTARYNYVGSDRVDITVKSGMSAFAPTWSMVMEVKNGKLSEALYTESYVNLMRDSYRSSQGQWQMILAREEATIVCFCAVGCFCHRYLLKDILVKLGANYLGEKVKVGGSWILSA